MTFHMPENCRARDGSWGEFNTVADSKSGSFIISTKDPSWLIYAMASAREGWEHVSVVVRRGAGGKPRTPTWEEMCIVKDLFWDPEDMAVQYHPPKSQYVSSHPNCLHLWRPTVGIVLSPPKELVGGDGIQRGLL